MASPAAPTDFDILRYRFHHGTNLGSLFVLEQWLFPPLFPPDCPAELDAVTASVRSIGLDETRHKWEAHWRNTITPEDWEFLSISATAIRLPIGFYHLGPDFCVNTPFADVAPVYKNAMTVIREIVILAEANGLGVLLDLHALPGGANDQHHSGWSGKTYGAGHSRLGTLGSIGSGALGKIAAKVESKVKQHIMPGTVSTSGTQRAEFWENRHYRELGTRAVEKLASFCAEEQVKTAIVGLQIINEADTISIQKGLWEWYDEAIAAVHRIDPDLPVIVSDAWNAQAGADYVAKQTHPTLLDIHTYFCFPPHDTKHPNEILNTTLPTTSLPAHPITGEYSAVLSSSSWSQIPSTDRSSMVSTFTRAQLTHYHTHSGSTYFWTYKMAWMPGGEWGFREQIEKGNLPKAQQLAQYGRGKLNLVRDQGFKEGLREQAMEDHGAYWGDGWGHEEFRRGWEVGWEDGVAFLDKGKGAVVGCVEVWARKRRRECGRGGEYEWEFEHGVKRGVRDVREVVFSKSG